MKDKAAPGLSRSIAAPLGYDLIGLFDPFLGFVCLVADAELDGLPIDFFEQELGAGCCGVDLEREALNAD